MKTTYLCGQCMILLREAFDVAEHGRREKITCENCGKRRYGCKCEVTQKPKGKHGTTQK